MPANNDSYILNASEPGEASHNASESWQLPNQMPANQEKQAIMQVNNGSANASEPGDRNHIASKA